ncbi:N-acetyl-beta-glucosaminyl-glycoprotein 4-beta-N-acetylgalactosaminyltransferase 1 isoform X2 [Nematostella vectensis]|nr:N-acetyl-beta-glucosaminyl-glycoprotein 4-beta-N-acetylgalactosaminyltransferase 1 isoform X2 [Nematostella vectensis]
MLTMHRWFESCTCGVSVDRGMRIYPRFPRNPEEKTTINSSELIDNNQGYGNRIFGYITPNASGIYVFAVSSDDYSELWLSSDSSPKNVQLIAHVGKLDTDSGPSSGYRMFNHIKGQVSQPINLTAHSTYYIEALHRNKGGDGHFTLAWNAPWMMNSSDFLLIDTSVLSPYFDDFEMEKGLLRMREECVMSDHMTLELHKAPNLNARGMESERDHYCHKVPKLNHSAVADALPYCYYMASYTPTTKVSGYYAYIRDLARPTDIYPDDKTTLINNEGVGKGNQPIPEKEVNQVVHEYLAELLAIKKDKYEFLRILNVERKVDSEKGYRYLLELELKHKITNRLVRLSEFVYKFNDKYISKNPNTTTSLCYPEGFQWSQEPKIYIILPVQNYGFWIMYLIDSLSHIYTSTPERNFHLVIVDFNTTDINIEDYLKKSALNKSYTFVKMKGSFFKTLALNTGVATVKDNNSIVFLMDLHITWPLCFFDVIRKHVIKGMAGFFPKLARLSCGASDLYPEGSWEWMGYGLFACYKEDWDRFGGEDVEKFKYTWGGEDWDLLDRVCSVQLEAERMCMPGLYHFPHEKKGDFYKKKKKPQ